MPDDLVVKKLAIKLSYKPSLTVFSRMDEAATSLGDLFPDWQRTPVSLSMRDSKTHRECHIKSDFCSFKTDGPADEQDELSLGGDTLEKLVKKFGISKLDRVGVQQLFIAKTSASFDALNNQLCSKMFVDQKNINALTDFKIKDMAYVIDVEDKAGWQRSLFVGPMTKGEWFKRYAADPNLFEATLEGANIFKFQESFPETFVFISIDASVEDSRRQETIASICREGARSREMAEQLLCYIES